MPQSHFHRYSAGAGRCPDIGHYSDVSPIFSHIGGTKGDRPIPLRWPAGDRTISERLLQKIWKFIVRWPTDHRTGIGRLPSDTPPGSGRYSADIVRCSADIGRCSADIVRYPVDTRPIAGRFQLAINICFMWPALSFFGFLVHTKHLYPAHNEALITTYIDAYWRINLRE